MVWDNNNNGDQGPWGRPQRENKGGKRPEYSENDIDKIIRDSQEKIKKIFSGGGGGSGAGGDGNNKKIIGIIVAIIFGLWLASGVYTVGAKQEGVVLRFGKYVQTTSPGLHYHLPSPIENVIKLSVTDRYHTEVGYRTGKIGSSTSVRGSGDGREILMLTGDENIVDVNFEGQWQIASAEKFLFNVYDPQQTLRYAAESAMREVIGTTPMNSILSEGRSIAQSQTKELLQKVLDSYDAGIKVEEINMRAVPPKNSISVDSITTDDDGNVKRQTVNTTVDEAFKDVQAAIINKEETINSATARANEIIPQARGAAERLLQEAKGYKEKVVAKSQGEAKRFTDVYDEYRKAKTVTKRRIYLETMEDVLFGMDKLVIDNKGNGVVPYLPLDKLNAKR